MLNGFSKMSVLALPKIYTRLLTLARLSHWTVRWLEIRARIVFFLSPRPLLAAQSIFSAAQNYVISV